MDREKLRDIFRKYRAVGLVLLAGLLLLLLPTGKSSGQERQTSDDTQLYSLEETEQRMAQLLGRMSGVGRVQVMLTLKTGPTLQLAQDMDLEQEEGSLRQRSQPVTVNRGSGWQEALVTRQDYPVYQGAVVVCQGAGSSAVRLAVTEAVAALTGLSQWCNGNNNRRDGHENGVETARCGGGGTAAGVRCGVHELAVQRQRQGQQGAGPVGVGQRQ